MNSTTTLTTAPTAENTTELESRYRARFNPPAGYKLSMTDWDTRELHLDAEYSGEWQDPTQRGATWLITSHWTNQGGLKFYADHATTEGRPDDEPFTAEQALEMAAALTDLVERLTD
ncbi:hypothetical protein [Arthrobacter sp. E3]|uniref:hypothetical protein n=1 Tax=Arthrobacter sp. E3 TaxID=517402 RepID=UPI001A941BAD|nr:hypothetical protein [Arthrobacter sp. E3]